MPPARSNALPPIWSALKKANKYSKVGTPSHVVVLSVDGDPQGCAGVKDGWMDAGYAQPLASMTRQSLQTIIDIVKDKKKIDDKDKIHLIPGVEYTAGNIAETADTVWGCAK